MSAPRPGHYMRSSKIKRAKTGLIQRPTKRMNYRHARRARAQPMQMEELQPVQRPLHAAPQMAQADATAVPLMRMRCVHAVSAAGEQRSLLEASAAAATASALARAPSSRGGMALCLPTKRRLGGRLHVLPLVPTFTDCTCCNVSSATVSAMAAMAGPGCDLRVLVLRSSAR